MSGIVDSIKEIGILPVSISITALLIILITVFLIIRRKKFKSVVLKETCGVHAFPKTTHELTLYLKDNLVKLLEDIDEERFKQAYETVEGYLKTISENFLLVVFGEFNAGKSSFINALLGEEILATGIVPTTATINRICYGDTAKQEIVFNDGRTQVVEDKEALFSYLVDEENLKRIDYVRTFYPSNKLRHLDIIDTPGLNSVFTYHEERALDFVHKADGVLWLFHPHQGGSQSEKEYLQGIKDYGKHIIGIMSHKDTIKSDEDISRLEDFIVDNFGDFIDQLFTISSRQALQSTISGDERGYVESGIGETEEYLTQNIFDRTKRAKIESVILSSQKSASHVSVIMGRELEQLNETKEFWDCIAGIIAQEDSSINRDIHRRVLRSLQFYFEQPRAFARQEIEKVFSCKEKFFACFRRKRDFTFSLNNEFWETLDTGGLESSIGAIIEHIKQRRHEILKRVEMELIIENEKRKKSGQELLGIENNRLAEEIHDQSPFENNEENLAQTFLQEDVPRVFSAHISFAELYGTRGKCFSQAKAELERMVFGSILDRQKMLFRHIMNRLIRMNEKVNNRLVQYLSACILRGSSDPDEFRDMMSLLERQKKGIDDVVDNLKRLCVCGNLGDESSVNVN